MKKKIVIKSLSFLLFLILVTFSSNEVEAYEGSGTPDDPYKLYTADDLRNVRADLNGHYVQMNDIDLKSEDFAMIGALNVEFKGVYDGNNFKIKNVKVITGSYMGVFSCIKDAVLKNIHIENAIVGSEGVFYGGALVGQATSSEITNCTVKGNGYINTRRAGGLIGIASNCNILDCVTNISIKGTEYLGGLIGELKGTSTIKRCYTINDIKIEKYLSPNGVGGIVGCINGIDLTLSECYSVGEMIGNQFAGGLTGRTQGGYSKVENCFSIASIEASGEVSGLIGGSATGIKSLKNSYFGGKLKGSVQYGIGKSLVTTSPTSVTVSSYFDGEKNIADNYTNSKLTKAMLKQATYSDWDFDGVWDIDEDVSYPYLKNLPSPDGVNVIPSNSPVESITVSPTSKSMEVHEILNLTYQVLPHHAVNKTVTFSSSDPSVAIVNERGQVVALSEGVADIKVESSNGKTAECKVTVGDGIKSVVPIEKFNLYPFLKVINVDETLQINSAITPNNATNKIIKWTSSNTSVLTVDENGFVKAKSVGFATVVALTGSGNHMAFCNIIVSGRTQNLALNAPVVASSYYAYQNAIPNTTNSPEKAVDGNPNTHWRMSNYNPGDMYLTIEFNEKLSFNQIKIKESGTEINEYTLQFWDEDHWVNIDNGIGIGDNFSLNFEVVYSSKVRLLINSRVSTANERLPSISEFEIYYNV